MALFGAKKEGEIKAAKTELYRAQEDLSDVSEYLDEFLAFLPLAVCDVSPVGMIVNVNKTLEKLSGFTAIHLVGGHLNKIFSERSQIDGLINLAKEEKLARSEELHLVTRDGRRIEVSVSLGARRDKENNLNGYFVSITDISELKKSQEKTETRIEERTKDLEESRSALLNILEDTDEARERAEEEKSKSEAIFKNFLDGLLVFNLEGYLELINPKAEEFLGVSRKTVLGRSIEELAKSPKLKPLIRFLEKGLREIFRQELSLEGGLVLEATTAFIISRKRKIAFLAILHDVTREKAVEELKSQFVSVAAHQLRTPLSIVKWSLGLFLEGDVGKFTREQRDIIEKTYQTNERMIRLVNDLLNIARIEEGRYVYQPRIVEFDELLEKVFSSLKEQARARKLSFTLDIEKSKKPKAVKVDIEKMTLAIKNLIENAIVYTFPKGKIIVRLKREKDQLEFSIQDTGVGIPKKQQSRIFSRFFRGANVIKMETEGTGLGLFIAKNIIEAHGGRMWFKSKENQGTTFYFTLPTIV